MADIKVAVAVRTELKALAERDETVAKGPDAATALALARMIDDPKFPKTAKANCADRMFDALDRVRAAAPPPQAKDAVDEVTARREARRAAARAADPAGS